MRKIIRFPLEMDEGKVERDVRELRENFYLPQVMNYYLNGKLVVWLHNHHETALADQVEKLDKDDTELARKVCDIFDVLLTASGFIY